MSYLSSGIGGAGGGVVPGATRGGAGMSARPLLAFVPLAAYTLALVAKTVALMPQGGVVRAVAAMPLMVLAHVMYGLGFWRGLFTRLSPPDAASPVPVTVERVRLETEAKFK